jgi:uncharacterized RDD family membrane protein YckC
MSARPVTRVEHRAADLHFERLRAPFSLRCGAVLIDYIVLVSILATATLLTRYSGEVRRGEATLLFVSYPVMAAVGLLNLVVLPGWTGRSLGKWVTGLRIERRDGVPLSFGRALLRHLVGYPVTCLTLGAGFLLAAFSSEGRALHDLLAGTVVVRSRGKAVVTSK